jgi:hypothetical protein
MTSSAWAKTPRDRAGKTRRPWRARNKMRRNDGNEPDQTSVRDQHRHR